MFGIGITELIIIFVVALIVLGPTQLPSFARSIGRAIREFRKTSDELRESIGLDGEISAPLSAEGRKTGDEPGETIGAGPNISSSEKPEDPYISISEEKDKDQLELDLQRKDALFQLNLPDKKEAND